VRNLDQVNDDMRQLVDDLRTTGLADEVSQRLADQALFDRRDLQESLNQMRRGEGQRVA
jgi:hypothetical protein